MSGETWEVLVPEFMPEGVNPRKLRVVMFATARETFGLLIDPPVTRVMVNWPWIVKLKRTLLGGVDPDASRTSCQEALARVVFTFEPLMIAEARVFRSEPALNAACACTCPVSDEKDEVIGPSWAKVGFMSV